MIGLFHTSETNSTVTVGHKHEYDGRSTSSLPLFVFCLVPLTENARLPSAGALLAECLVWQAFSRYHPSPQSFVENREPLTPDLFLTGGGRYMRHSWGREAVICGPRKRKMTT